MYNPSSVRWANGGEISFDLPDEMWFGYIMMMDGVYGVCIGIGATITVGATPGAGVVGLGAAGAGEGAVGATCGGVGTMGDIGNSVGTNNNATGGGGARATGGGARVAEYFWRRGISGGSEGA
jgi:hypothetical protein